MDYTIIIEKDPETSVYIGQCIQVPGALSQGYSYNELMENMKEAIELVVECQKEDLKERHKGRKVFYRKVTVNV